MYLAHAIELADRRQYYLVNLQSDLHGGSSVQLARVLLCCCTCCTFFRDFDPIEHVTSNAQDSISAGIASCRCPDLPRDDIPVLIMSLSDAGYLS